MKHPLKRSPAAASPISSLPCPIKQVLSSSGRSLDTAARKQMETRFGTDLSQVRIHTGDQATNSAMAVNAEAYTVGNHIAFAHSKFGLEMLAHEITHVLQQTTRDGPLLSAFQAEDTARANGRSPQIHAAPGHVPSPILQKQDAGENKPAKAETPASTVRAQYTKWIDSRIQYQQKVIESTKKKYEEKNWKLTDKDVQPQADRIAELQRLKSKITTTLSAADSHGQGALTLANIVVNEAGASNDSAKKAVAYAYMNRVGGTVREPTGKMISHYKKLEDRWADLSDTDRLVFLNQFADGLDAAVVRLSDNDPTKNDPTKGATHWVSPKGLKRYDPKKHKGTRYKRTVGTVTDKAFPTWARSATDPEVKKMQKAGQMGRNFQEFTVPDVTEEEFLFYTDVRFKD